MPKESGHVLLYVCLLTKLFKNLNVMNKFWQFLNF